MHAGVREGGQFATEAKAEAGVTLTAPAVAEEQVVEAYTPVYKLPEAAVEDAKHRIEKANRRLERAGIQERFEMTWGEPYVRKVGPQGSQVDRWYRDLELSAPAISYGGWEFVAALDQAGPNESDLVARTRPGAELNGWRPESIRCDHCGKSRARSVTYVVRHEDGTIKQVGSSCMQNFLGIRPSGLWTLDMDPLDKAEEEWTDASYSSGLGDAATAEDVIRTAIAATEGGKHYVSASAAQYGAGASTADTVKKALGLWSVGPQERDEIAGVAAGAQQVSDADVQEVLAFAREIEGEGDYATNLRMLAAQEWTGTRHVGILASAVSAWAREKGRRVERERKLADYVPGHMAPEGEKVKGHTVTVTKVSYLDDPYSYYGGVNTLVIMRDEAGHEVKWFASGRKELDAGQLLALTGGTVKKHDVYADRDQTVITRVKYDILPAAGELSEAPEGAAEPLAAGDRVRIEDVSETTLWVGATGTVDEIRPGGHVRVRWDSQDRASGSFAPDRFARL